MNTPRSLTTVGLAVTAILATSAARAADAPPVSTLEEVVVTAQKRTTSLQNVPFSVSATSEEQIRNSGSGSLVDLARNIAGLSIADLGPGQSQMAIRGISSGQVIRDQPGVKEQVGVYLDESPISVALFTPDLELFDLDRFEVLRGPQGTLFGSGSEAGTLRYITAQPKLGSFEGVADASLDLPKDGSTGGSIRGAINLPTGDTSAVRLVGYERHLPGFIGAIQPGGSVVKAVNDGDRAGFRLAMLWKPNDQLSITPRVVYQSLTTNGYPREDVYNILANPYTTTQPAITIGDRQQFTQQHEGISDNFTLFDVKLDYNFGPATLTSVSSYTHRDVLVIRDATQLTGSVTYDIFGDVPQIRTSSPLYDHTHLNVVSEELRIGSNGSSTVDWLAGGFFQHISRRYGQDLPTPGYDALTGVPGTALNAPPDTPFFSDLTYHLKQYAVFGEATWHFADQWAATGGVRYYKYDEDRVLNFGGYFANDTGPGGVPGSVKSDGVSPRAILSYKVNEDAQFNAQVSKGFRLGGINDPINLPLCSPEDKIEFGGAGNWKDETTRNYELGGKFRFADRKVTFNVSAFYTEIRDLQATVTAGTCSSRIIYNVPKAQSHGLEAELFARPNANWDFGLSATWVDATLQSSVISTSTTGGVTTTKIIGGLAEGNRLPTAPKFQGVASVGFTTPLDEQKDFFSVLTAQFVGSSYSQFENEVPGFGQVGGSGARLIPYGGVPANTTIGFNPELGSYSIGNIRAGIRTKAWEFAGYLNNIWDTNAHLAIDYERGRSARVAFLTNQPRTIGLTVQYKF